MLQLATTMMDQGPASFVFVLVSSMTKINCSIQHAWGAAQRWWPMTVNMSKHASAPAAYNAEMDAHHTVMLLLHRLRQQLHCWIT